MLVVALLLAGVAMWWLRTRSGAVRTTTGADVTEVRAEVEVLRSLGVRPEDADLTVVQFATAFCAPCRATKARLAQLQTRHPALAAVHVDAESHLDAVRALDVRRTPTLFYLGRDGALLGRSSGAPRPDELQALVAAHAPAAGHV
ncbi:Thiol-disulfide isomerase or thioredoxin [Klenkia soli]|uniref:Thiol-disulfide isomerase or thioredoxin n=1 Tax=Klenkia soli TaxID=1052260 RepID=A0A1H0UBR1_9ACTN|nr:Thiol-disulfide isomerase or thioredoxin [Klenkia soli]